MYAKIKDDAISRLTNLLEARDLKALGDFQLNYANQYRDALATQMRNAYEYGKHAAADELKVGAPGTKRESAFIITQQAQAITDKQMSDLLFMIKAQVLGDVRKHHLSETNLSLTDILGAVSAAFGAFFNNKVDLTAGAIIMQGINRGRADVFQANRDNIYAYQWSARLENSCPICTDLDGSVVDYAGYMDTVWNPPIHYRCACLWVAISRDELDPPEITGLPDKPGGAEDPSL